ncbi:MAG: L,D-transpeptidase family protein [Ferruginibacter sp.]
MSPGSLYRFPIALFTVFILSSCNSNDKAQAQQQEQQIVTDPASMDENVKQNIESILGSENPKTDDSIAFSFSPVVRFIYTQNEFKPSWSKEEKWLPQVQQFLNYLDTAVYDGLFKEDYAYRRLLNIKNSLEKDSIKTMDAVRWAKADLAFTNAFMNVLQDLAQGRLQPESKEWRNDSSRYESFFSAEFKKFTGGEDISAVFNPLQPKHKGYVLLRSGIRKFTDSMDKTVYTYLFYPNKDSLAFVKTLKKRLAEGGYRVDPAVADSISLPAAIKKYQQKKAVKADGKISTSLVRMLNNTGPEKLKRIAIALDKYKQLPARMPEKYIWVNLPTYYLQLVDHDTVALLSKIVCGKTATPTPEITSAIDNLVTYPTWTVPSSIIEKDLLPGLKRNPNHLARRGLALYTSKGTPVNPYTINWQKYKKGIPFLVRQGSGDGNALGVMKFNFKNPYDVYLHDTNQRYLFKKGVRNLSHGCVRVQEWEKLAFYIARYDSSLYKPGDTLRYNTDSISNWIAQKEMHKIEVKNKFPLFIRYFGCEMVNGAIKFYDDMYGYDRELRERYFAMK